MFRFQNNTNQRKFQYAKHLLALQTDSKLKLLYQKLH